MTHALAQRLTKFLVVDQELDPIEPGADRRGLGQGGCEMPG